MKFGANYNPKGTHEWSVFVHETMHSYRMSDPWIEFPNREGMREWARCNGYSLRPITVYRHEWLNGKELIGTLHTYHAYRTY